MSLALPSFRTQDLMSSTVDTVCLCRCLLASVGHESGGPTQVHHVTVIML